MSSPSDVVVCERGRRRDGETTRGPRAGRHAASLERDPAPHVRLGAIEAIGRLAPVDALEILEPLTRSPNEDIARAAITALGHVEQADALSALEADVRGPASWQRPAAIDALTMRSETRVPEILQWTAAADQDLNVVRAAMDALAKSDWYDPHSRGPKLG